MIALVKYATMGDLSPPEREWLESGEGGVWVLFATGQSEGELSWNKAQQSNIRTENSNKDIKLLPSISSRVLLLITVDDELGNKNEK